MDGTVAAVMNFGVFVDVQGVRGMIHVSQVRCGFGFTLEYRYQGCEAGHQYNVSINYASKL